MRLWRLAQDRKIARLVFVTPPSNFWIQLYLKNLKTVGLPCHGTLCLGFCSCACSRCFPFFFFFFCFAFFFVSTLVAMISLLSVSQVWKWPKHQAYINAFWDFDIIFRFLWPLAWAGHYFSLRWEIGATYHRCFDQMCGFILKELCSKGYLHTSPLMFPHALYSKIAVADVASTEGRRLTNRSLLRTLAKIKLPYTKASLHIPVLKLAPPCLS